METKGASIRLKDQKEPQRTNNPHTEMKTLAMGHGHMNTLHIELTGVQECPKDFKTEPQKSNQYHQRKKQSTFSTNTASLHGYGCSSAADVKLTIHKRSFEDLWKIQNTPNS